MEVLELSCDTFIFLTISKTPRAQGSDPLEKLSLFFFVPQILFQVFLPSLERLTEIS